MKINIKATGIQLTPAISDYVEKKLSVLSKHIDQGGADPVVQVEVGKITQHHKSGEVFRAEVHIIGGGLDAYAASEQTDLYAAIDMVKDEIVRTVTQGKDKKLTLTRRGGQAVKNMMKGLSFWKRRS
ncbi:ribosome-associated translation inhibitor RaiA [Candidatus Parcubacteria bacterium]|nr:ribosome-associated translation inhibitor RaiA [Candidatus Parcubacteria bacterium]